MSVSCPVLPHPAARWSGWSPTSEALLRELWPLFTPTLIGRRLGITRNAVIGKATRLHLPHIEGRLAHEPEAQPTAAVEVRLVPSPVAIVPVRECQWPFGARPDYRFCHAALPPGDPGPYCAQCRKRAYQPMPKRGAHEATQPQTHAA